MTQKERLVDLVRRADRAAGSSIFVNLDKYHRDVADYLLENGVFVPPCKVGDVLYEPRIDHHDTVRIKPYLVEEILVENDDKVHIAVCDVNNTEGTFCEDQIGKTVFLTKDEARQALKEHK